MNKMTVLWIYIKLPDDRYSATNLLNAKKPNILINSYSSIVTLGTTKLIPIAIKLSLNLILCQRCETHVFGVCLCFGEDKNQRRKLMLKSSAMKDNCYMLLLCLGYPKDTAKITHIYYLKNHNFALFHIHFCMFLDSI